MHDQSNMTLSDGSRARGRPQPLRDLLGTLARGAPIVVVAAGLAALAVLFLTAPGEDDDQVAVIRIGLTDEVNWPFYDAARERVVRTIESDELRAQAVSIATDSGGELLSLETEVPVNQAFLDLVVTASSTELAVEIAAQSGQFIVETSLAETTAARSDAVAESEQVQVRMEERLAQYDVELDAAITAESDARNRLAEDGTSVVAREDLTRAELERQGLVQARNEAQRQYSNVLGDLAERQVSLAAVEPEVEVLRRAAEAASEDDSSALLAAAVFTAVALIGMGAVIAWDRSRGRVRSAWQLTELLGTAVLADAGTSDTDATVGLLASRIIDSASGPRRQNRVAVLSMRADTSVAVTIAAALQVARSGRNVAVLAPRGTALSNESRIVPLNELGAVGTREDGVTWVELPEPRLFAELARNARVVREELASHVDLVLVAVAAEASSQFVDHDLSLAESAVIVVQDGRDRVTDVASLLDSCERRGVNVLGAALVDRSPSSVDIRVEEFTVAPEAVQTR